MQEGAQLIFLQEAVKDRNDFAQGESLAFRMPR